VNELQKAPFIDLPLHTGHAPAYLIRRMTRLSRTISKAIIDEYGQQEFLRRLSDPLWFQAFGCVLGFDWHSSGLTTVVSGILKQAVGLDTHGVGICGGKGKEASYVKESLQILADKFGLSSAKIESLLYASKMTAKIDSAAVQDGYSLYHHIIIFDSSGNWAIVQQGMNTHNLMARRYHWLSEGVKNFVYEPHAGIISKYRSASVLDMTAKGSVENQQVCVELVKENPDNLRSSVYRLTAKDSLDKWLGADDNNNHVNVTGYEMPRRIDWKLFKKIYDIQPKNYEELLLIQGVGRASIRALSLIAELIYGARASWNDPVKYSFAHGGKDGVPYPIAKKVYDKSIEYLHNAIEGADIGRDERITALKKLSMFSTEMFSDH
jgi:hypothetical protein